MNAWISTAIHIADEPAISHDVGDTAILGGLRQRALVR